MTIFYLIIDTTEVRTIDVISNLTENVTGAFEEGISNAFF